MVSIYQLTTTIPLFIRTLAKYACSTYGDADLIIQLRNHMNQVQQTVKHTSQAHERDEGHTNIPGREYLQLRTI